MVKICHLVYCLILQNLKKVSTKHVHQILPNIQQTFIRTAQNEKAGISESLVYVFKSKILGVSVSSPLDEHNSLSENQKIDRFQVMAAESVPEPLGGGGCS